MYVRNMTKPGCTKRVKAKATPLDARGVPEVSKIIRLPDFQNYGTCR